MAIVTGFARATIKWLAVTAFAIATLAVFWWAIYSQLNIVGHLQ